ncbi:MAG: SAM hydroxide adenosyltransferase [Opitutaceae bacterium]
MRTLVLILPLLLPPILHPAADDFTVIDGVLDGAPYQIAIPARINGNVLIHAHGFRPVEEPLVAELELENTAHRRFLDNGWIIAMSAYRRNGMIVEDAMTDLLNLRDRIEEDQGPLAMVVLEGQSMGGAIVTHLAESHQDRFHGALALGAALGVTDPGQPLSLSHRPRIPLLFVSNRSEMADPLDYVAAAADASVRPVLWTVDRDGHVNLNEDERLIALDALVAWISTGMIDPDRDITVEHVPEVSEVVLENGTGIGRVIRITSTHGNVFINFNDRDFRRLSISPGDDFRLTIGETSVTVRFGTTFSDVPVGAWIAFPTADGDTIVAINRGNAFNHLQPGIGDPVRITPLDQ